MVIRVDIDETICTSPSDRNYANATPIQERIKHINDLYDEGHTIIYWTARGATTGIDWRAVTEKHFKEWGVKYHELHLNKPAYDLFIDDKNINSDTYFSNI